jgi:outer membrane receptor protein involved in Fe transport
MLVLYLPPNHSFIHTEMKKNTLKTILSFIAISLPGQHGFAQTVHHYDDTLQMPSIYLDEITIRAPKQAMTLHELPASASVVSARNIERAGIKSIKDVTAYTPNFFMPDYGSKLTSPIYIRGIGSRINEPSVGLYVDNVPYFDKAAFDFDLFDIDRIEVLRGPQGTLYGRNTMGGIINIITRSPMDYQGTKVMFSAGNYGNYQGGLSHFLKLSDRFGYSVSLNYTQRDGFFTNAYNDEKVDKLVNFGIRNRLVWSIGNKFTIENILGFEYSRQGGYPYATVDENNKLNDINYDHPSSYDRDLVTNGLVLKNKGRTMDLIATTSYQYIDDLQNVDQDFTANPIFQATQSQLQHLMSQEVVLKSKPFRRLAWLGGVYFFFQGFDRSVRVDVPANNMVQMIDFADKRQGNAFFFQATYHDLFVERFSVTAGVRMDGEQSRLDYQNIVYLNGTSMPAPDTIFTPLEFVQLSPKLAFNYEVSNFTSVYATFSKGYKTGGFNSNLIRAEDLKEHLHFEPEDSWNYEIGVKTTFMQNKVQAEAALFYIDWSNQQIFQPVPTGQGTMLKNAGESVSKGFELSARANPFHNFDVVLAYGFTDARFVTHVVDSLNDYSDNYIPYVPRHTFSLQLSQVFDLPDNGLAEQINISALYRGVGKHYWNEQNTQFQDSYGLLDMRVGVKRGDLRMDIWAKNLLGTEYSAFYFEIPQLRGRYAQPGRPFHFGINLTVTL